MTATKTPVLTRAEISFSTQDPNTDNHNPNATGGPNKDWNTNIDVQVVATDGTVVAHLSDTEGNFPYPSNEGPYALALTESTATKDTLIGGSVRIHIDPVGNDDWSFNAFAQLSFSDGSSLTASENGVQLGDGHQDTDLSLS
jgi:hypothetical protein